MATENRDWGYARIRGALANLGHRVARGTIANILKRHGIEPAPERSKKTTWQEFLQTHWEVLAAADSFTVEVWTRSGLVRVLVLFVIELSTRRVEIAGISPQPDGALMTQTAHNLTDAEDGFLVGKKYLIHDRDTLFTQEFQETLGSRPLTPIGKASPMTSNVSSENGRARNPKSVSLSSSKIRRPLGE